MIRRADPGDEAQIRDCAEQAYARYVAIIGRKPAPMVADFKAKIAAGQVYVAAEGDAFQGFIVFFPKGNPLDGATEQKPAEGGQQGTEQKPATDLSSPPSFN